MITHPNLGHLQDLVRISLSNLPYEKATELPTFQLNLHYPNRTHFVVQRLAEKENYPQ